MQTQIVLKKFDVEKLGEVSRKVMEIYADAFQEVDKTRVSPRFIKSMIEKVTNRSGRVDIVLRPLSASSWMSWTSAPLW